MKILISTLWLSFLVFRVLAQVDPPTLHRELVLGSSLQGELGLIYKWETAHRRFWRLSGAFIRGNLTDLPGEPPRLNAGLGLAFGREIRLPVTDKLDFLHGPQFSLGLNGLWRENQAQFALSPGFSYLLGALYQVNEQLYLGVEGGPSLSSSFNFQNGRLLNRQFATRFSTAQLQLTLGYRFARQQKQ